jgi:hypothetical protein
MIHLIMSTVHWAVVSFLFALRREMGSTREQNLPHPEYSLMQHLHRAHHALSYARQVSPTAEGWIACSPTRQGGLHISPCSSIVTEVHQIRYSNHITACGVQEHAARLSKPHTPPTPACVAFRLPSISRDRGLHSPQLRRARRYALSDEVYFLSHDGSGRAGATYETLVVPRAQEK